MTIGRLFSAALAVSLVACGGRTGPVPGVYSDAMLGNRIIPYSPDVLPGTVFVSVADGGDKAGVRISSPPYDRWKTTKGSVSQLPIGLTGDGDLVIGQDTSNSELWSITAPYTGNPQVLAHGITDAIAMAIDETNNVFLSEYLPGKNGAFIREYLAPKYRPVALFGQPHRDIGSEGVVSLPSGRIAVASISEHLGPGSLDIYTPQKGGFNRSSVPGLSFPQQLATDSHGVLIATECPRCDGASGNNFIAIIPSPYTRISKKLSSSTTLDFFGVVTDKSRAIFANENNHIVWYPYPYNKKAPLRGTNGTYALGVSDSGTLIFGRYTQPFWLKSLSPPYSQNPKTLLYLDGLPESIIFSR